MNCNQDIHNEIKEAGLVICAFCNTQIKQYCPAPHVLRCSNQEIISDHEKFTCFHCAQQQGDDLANEYVDFYENMYKIHKKAVYHRKYMYHIENVIRDLTAAYNIQITGAQINQILGKFNEIQKVLPQVNNGRKRMISIKFILRHFFQIMGIQYWDKIPISKSTRTLNANKQYLNQIQSLIGDQLN